MKKIIGLFVVDKAKTDGSFGLPLVALDEEGTSYGLCLNQSGGVDLRPREGKTADQDAVQKEWTRREVQALVNSKGGQAGETHLINEFLPALGIELPTGEFLGEKVFWYFLSFVKKGEVYVGSACAHAHLPTVKKHNGRKEDLKKMYPDVEIKIEARSVEIFSSPHIYPEYEDLYFMVPKSLLLD